MVWNALFSSSVRGWTQVRARRQEPHAKRTAEQSKPDWIYDKCAAACFNCCQTCRKRHATRDGTEEIVSGIDVTTGSGQPTDQAKGNETADSKATRLRAPLQQEQTRTALQNAMSAGSPRAVITRLGQGRRCNHRESCVGISPGRTWTWMLTLTAIAYHVRTHARLPRRRGKHRRGTRHGQRTWSTRSHRSLSAPCLSFSSFLASTCCQARGHATKERPAGGVSEPGCKCTKRTRTRAETARTPSGHGRMGDQEPQPQRGSNRDVFGWAALLDMQTGARRALEDTVVLRPGDLTGRMTDEYTVTATSLLQRVDRLFLVPFFLRACAAKRMTMLLRRALDMLLQRPAGGVPREPGPERQSQTTPSAHEETRNATESPASSRGRR